MKLEIDHGEFDTKLVASDWRFSASIVGLLQYFDYHGIKYEAVDNELHYKQDDITKHNYARFVDYYYQGKMHHQTIESVISNDNPTEGMINLINEKLKANTVLKKVFKDLKYSVDNKEKILELLTLHREDIILETFKNKKDMYHNYCNSGLLLKEAQDVCRLKGYYLDMGKKGKSNSYNFNKSAFNSSDLIEFDFIPFAFLGGRETIFVNDNISIKELYRTYKELNQKIKTIEHQQENDDSESFESNNIAIDIKKVVLKAIQEIPNYLNYDVEVILKDQDNEYFQSVYIRKQAINTLKRTKHLNYDMFGFVYRIPGRDDINIYKRVIRSILNSIVLDHEIEALLKDRSQRSYIHVISQLITINSYIRGGGNMNAKMKKSYESAKKVAAKLPENKVNSYRQRLISTIVLKDYDKACQTLLQLSNYSKIEFEFLFDVFEDFEENKDVVYTFINALTKKKSIESEE